MPATAALPLAIAREETSAAGKALPALVVPAGLVNPSWVAQRVAASQCHPFVKEGPAAAGGLQGRQSEPDSVRGTSPAHDFERIASPSFSSRSWQGMHAVASNEVRNLIQDCARQTTWRQR